MSEGAPTPEKRRGHAGERVSSRAVWAGVLGLLAIVGASAGISAWLVLWLEAERPVPSPQQRAVLEQRGAPEAPGPFDDLAELRRELEAEQLQRIRTTAWVDRAENLARVPIERAMRHIVEHGLPDFGGGPPAEQPGSPAEKGSAAEGPAEKGDVR